MTRKLAILLALLAFGGGLVTGIYVRQNALQTAVIVANAKADAYMLAATETARACQPPRGGWFKP